MSLTNLINEDIIMAIDKNERAAQKYPATKKVKASPEEPKRPFTNMNGTNVYPETKIAYISENPKRKNSAAYGRFAKYMKAKTIAEFEKLGGTRADLKYDHSKEFVSIAK